MEPVRTSHVSALLFPFPCWSTPTSRTASQVTCHDGLRDLLTALFCFTWTKFSNWATGTLQFPGGHLEFGEDPFQCAVRETEEETGLKVVAEKNVTFTNDVFKAENKHYITLFVSCRRLDEQQEPEVSLARQLFGP